MTRKRIGHFAHLKAGKVLAPDPAELAIHVVLVFG